MRGNVVNTRMRVLPIGEGETPEIDSVEFSRGWTADELSELVREGRNLVRGPGWD